MKRKKRYGTGVINVFRGRFRVRVPKGDGTYLEVGSFDTIEEAEQQREAGLVAVSRTPVGITLRVYAHEWFRRIKKQRNFRSWHSTWGSIVVDAPFIDDPIDSLEHAEIRRWAREDLPKKLAKRSVLKDGKRVTSETKRPISRQTAQHALGLLKRSLEEAKGDGIREDNPADGVELPREDVQREPPVFLSSSEIDSLFAHAALPLEQRTVFTVAIFQGLREGEIAGLDWSSVEWSAPGLWISEAWGGKLTKTARTRWQAMLPATVDALMAWWEERGRPTRGLVFPSPRRGPRGEIVAYTKGHDWGWSDHRASVGTRPGWWRKCGIETRITFHMLRDTCASHLLSGTWGEPWEIKRVSVHIGHTAVAVTERRYAHLTRKALLEAARKTKRGGSNSGGGRSKTWNRSGTRERRDKSASCADISSENASNKAFPMMASPAGVEPATNGLGSKRASSNLAALSGEKPGTCQIQLRERLLGALGAVVDAMLARRPVHGHLLADVGEAAIDLGEAFGEMGEQLLSGSPHALDVLGELAGLARALGMLVVESESEVG